MRAAVHGDLADFAPPVQRLHPVRGEQRPQQGAEVKRVQLLEQQHAHARRDVVEEAHEHHNPPHAGESADERLDDAPQPRQRLGQSEH
eukprot:CAMPEP_0171981296 /NCGR_PEP_ID=MMETSP0993-20121228/265868_1 /TAXON_ID=483369 /ORGANISM="non described non described, Strain CCMP2098" /LENGTH=87 /DNA_ID=CAMNT_0012633723 /DNA_START=55 /DNA_END=315 /DNA_ORIENTATION=-